MEEFPAELIVFLCAFLSRRNVVALSRVCTKFRKTITSLFPMHARIRESDRCQEIADAMCSGWPGIVTVKCASLTDSAMHMLIDLSHLQTLVLFRCPFLSPQGFNCLFVVRGYALKELSISSCPGFSRRVAERHIESLTALKTLALGGIGITNAVLGQVSCSSTIETLMCNAAQYVNPKACASLANMPKLRELVFMDCPAMTGRGSAIRKRMRFSKSIESVTLHSYDTTPREGISLVMTKNNGGQFIWSVASDGIKHSSFLYDVASDFSSDCVSDKASSSEASESQVEDAMGDSTDEEIRELELE